MYSLPIYQFRRSRRAHLYRPRWRCCNHYLRHKPRYRRPPHRCPRINTSPHSMRTLTGRSRTSQNLYRRKALVPQKCDSSDLARMGNPVCTQLNWRKFLKIPTQNLNIYRGGTPLKPRCGNGWWGKHKPHSGIISALWGNHYFGCIRHQFQVPQYSSILRGSTLSCRRILSLKGSKPSWGRRSSPRRWRSLPQQLLKFGLSLKI